MCVCVCVCVCVCQPHLEYFFGVFGRLVQDDELVSAEKTSLTEALLILRYSTYVLRGGMRWRDMLRFTSFLTNLKVLLTMINLWKNYSSIILP